MKQVGKFLPHCCYAQYFLGAHIIGQVPPCLFPCFSSAESRQFDRIFIPVEIDHTFYSVQLGVRQVCGVAAWLASIAQSNRDGAVRPCL